MPSFEPLIAQVARPDRFTGVERGQILDDIPQLPDIAGEIVRGKSLERFGRKPQLASCAGRLELHGEMFYQRWDIFPPLT